MASDKGEIVIYQPQIESYEDNVLESRAAVSVKPTGQDTPVFGAMWFRSFLATDLETRTATLERVEVTAARFPDIDEDKVDRLSRFLEEEIPRWDIEFSLDRLVASLPEEEGGDAGFSAEPPVIHHRTVPAVLVLIDGDPVLADLEGYDLRYVANSAFFIVTDGRTGYYLRGAGTWFESGDVGGPWNPADDLPPEVARVGARVEQEEAAQAEEMSEDAAALELEADPDEPAPEIIVSTVPAELIVTAGEPDFAPVPDTQLLYLKNTETDVLMDIPSQRYYVLLSGRWFSAKSLDGGEWSFVPFDDLPADFADIPEDSDMASVRPSVPGTVEAQEAVLETQIPQTAEIDRRTATVAVTYDGDPRFEKCGDSVAYAVNTDKSVLLIGSRYYCVDDAVWFEAAGPTGPWSVAAEVPVEVTALGPECPVYNVKYVYIYDATPEVVYVGYTPGYYGSYVWGPCVVYGTGWYYRPWWGAYYYPRPVTYGWGVHYNPWTGWGFSFGVSYGWVSIGVGWGRPAYPCWGPGGYRYGYRHGYWHGYNHGYRHGYRHGAAAGYRAGYRAAQRQPHANLYRQRPDGVKRTGDVRRDGGRRPATARDRKNDVYTDRNGDLYRDREGKWEKREDGKWSEDRSRDRDGSREARPEDRSGRDRPEEDRTQKDRSRQDRQQTDRDRTAPDRSAPDRSQRDRQQMDRSRQGSSPQQLDRDRSGRNRGAERQRQAPPRSGGSQRGGAGGRRR